MRTFVDVNDTAWKLHPAGALSAAEEAMRFVYHRLFLADVDLGELTRGLFHLGREILHDASVREVSRVGPTAGLPSCVLDVVSRSYVREWAYSDAAWKTLVRDLYEHLQRHEYHVELVGRGLLAS